MTARRFNLPPGGLWIETYSCSTRPKRPLVSTYLRVGCGLKPNNVLIPLIAIQVSTYLRVSCGLKREQWANDGDQSPQICQNGHWHPQRRIAPRSSCIERVLT